MKSFKSGFTLIELIVVIGLIAIAASIVLVVGNARDQGRDAAIQKNLSHVQKRAEILFIEDNNYNRVCGSNSVAQDSEIARALVEVVNNNPEGASGIICAVSVSGDAPDWAISVKMNSQDGYWCTDSAAFTGLQDDPLDSTNDLSCS